MFLPTEIVDILDQLRSIGVSERTVQMERDGWILVTALLPQSLGEWIPGKKAALADPRLEKLVEAMLEYAVRHQDRVSEQPDWTSDKPAAVSLLFAHVATVSPAWSRLRELVQERLRELPQPRHERRPGWGSRSLSASAAKSSR